MKRESAFAIQGALAVAGAFLSDRLGVLYSVLCVLMGLMALNYVTGMLVSKNESIATQEVRIMAGKAKKGLKESLKRWAISV